MTCVFRLMVQSGVEVIRGNAMWYSVSALLPILFVQLSFVLACQVY